jgi:hypothetical protein
MVATNKSPFFDRPGMFKSQPATHAMSIAVAITLISRAGIVLVRKPTLIPIIAMNVVSHEKIKRTLAHVGPSSSSSDSSNIWKFEYPKPFGLH